MYIFFDSDLQGVNVSTGVDDTVVTTDGETVNGVVDEVVVQNDQVIENLQEVLSDNSSSSVEPLQEICNLLHVILVVLLLQWAFERLNVISHKFGSTGGRS